MKGFSNSLMNLIETNRFSTLTRKDLVRGMFYE